MGAFADTIGVAVGMKTGFKSWLDDITERMMNNAIAKRSGADFTTFGFVDGEMTVSAWLVSLLLEFLLQINKMVGKMMFEASGSRPTTFAACRFVIC